MFNFFKNKDSEQEAGKEFKFRDDVVLRFNLLVICVFTLAGIIILGKAAIIMFIERDDWNKIKERNIKYNVPIEANRGNILADDGGLIVSTLPRYRMLFDFEYINKDKPEEAKAINARRDSIWKKDLRALCIGLNEILPGTSVEELESRFKIGLTPSKKTGRKKGGYQPYKGNISYSQFRKIKELPIIREGKTLSGCYTQETIERKNILGNTGNSTFGIIRSFETDSNKVVEVNGLEKKYNDFLKGEDGSGTKAKFRGKYILREDRQPVNGYDVQTTLNTQMLDICHNALERVLREKHLAAGWAILMETKTGDIKAIVNLARHQKRNGTIVYVDTIGNIKYNQTANHALCDLNEPGSIFKTVAMTAMLADGRLTTKDSVIAYESRVHNFNGHKIHDEMYRDNGTGKYSMTDAMMYSSNISMVQFIRKAYPNDPEEYTNTLQRFGLTENYRITDNESTPYLTLPGTNKWNGYSLNSMSYGYAVGMTAINMVTFYNTIANGGKQMRPRIVKAILDNGEIIEEYPTEVINESLFPKEVADTVTQMLVAVVNGKSITVNKSDWRYGKRDGTGKAAYSDIMTIAGKTGTAKAYDGNKKLMSFCGFFPAEAPEYTLIVQMMYDKDIDPRSESEQKANSYGGGSTSALAFKEIAEKIMTEKYFSPIENAVDKQRSSKPKIKKGNKVDDDYLLKEVGLIDSIPAVKKENDEWGQITYYKKGVPDVTGMGAKDATYLLQKKGKQVKLEGYGKVNELVTKGDTVILKLKP